MRYISPAPIAKKGLAVVSSSGIGGGRRCPVRIGAIAVNKVSNASRDKRNNCFLIEARREKYSPFSGCGLQIRFLVLGGVRHQHRRVIRDLSFKHVIKSIISVRASYSTRLETTVETPNMAIPLRQPCRKIHVNYHKQRIPNVDIGYILCKVSIIQLLFNTFLLYGEVSAP